MFIKLYIHPNKLENLKNNESILAQQMPNSQYEVEIYVDYRKYNVKFQSNGVLVSKRRLWRR